MNDSEIVGLFRARDGEALARAEEAYGRYCLSVALNITGDEEDARECVNDALFAAWNSIPPACPSVLRTYLGKLTRNLAINRREANRARKRGGGEADLIYEELGEALGSAKSAEDEAMGRALTEAVNAFLASLDEEKRLLFVRRYWYADSVGDLAARFGMRENTVSAALGRIRKKLKTYLTQEGFTV